MTSAVVDHVREGFVMSAAPSTSPVPGLAASGGVEGEEVQSGTMDEAPVCEGCELPVFEEVGGDGVCCDGVEGLPLVRFAQKVGIKFFSRF